MLPPGWLLRTRHQWALFSLKKNRGPLSHKGKLVEAGSRPRRQEETDLVQINRTLAEDREVMQSCRKNLLTKRGRDMWWRGNGPR